MDPTETKWPIQGHFKIVDTGLGYLYAVEYCRHDYPCGIDSAWVGVHSLRWCEDEEEAMAAIKEWKEEVREDEHDAQDHD